MYYTVSNKMDAVQAQTTNQNVKSGQFYSFFILGLRSCRSPNHVQANSQIRNIDKNPDR